MNDTLQRIHGRQVLDSRGTPTVEVEVHCAGGAWGRAIVPSGASTGTHEAHELRDGVPAEFGGKGVRHAVRHVNEVLAPAILGMPAAAQRSIDQRLLELDGTPNKGRLGANALLGVSLACAHAAAAAGQIPLWRHIQHLRDDQGALPGPSMPLPMVNLISGGLHAGRQLECQDFLFLPIAARSYSEALAQTVAVYRALSDVLREAGHEGVLVGDEGGFAPKLASNRQALDLIVAAFRRVGLHPGKDAAIAVDVASTHFQRDGQYEFEGRSLTAADMAGLLACWTRDYPILSIEDGMAEDDWAGWRLLTDALGKHVQLIGDDLFVTQPARLERGHQSGVANSILIKVNQVGTLTETLDVLALARRLGYRTIVSARSGETEDVTIAHLAVGAGAGQIKIGSVARGERLAKYNELLRIEEQLGPDAPFAGWSTVA